MRYGLCQPAVPMDVLDPGPSGHEFFLSLEIWMFKIIKKKFSFLSYLNIFNNII